GIHHESAGRWPEAIDAYRHGIVAQPDSPELYIRWGIALSRQERWHEAAERYRRAVDTDSMHVDAHLHLGVALDRIGRHEEAIARLEIARGLEPTSTSVLFYLGTTLERAARQAGDDDYFDRAVVTFQDLIKQSPEDAYALNYLGYMFAERGIRLKEAVSLLERAIAIEPDSSAFLDSLGWIYFKLGQFPMAEEYLNKAISHMQVQDEVENEEQAVILDHAGDIAAALGKRGEAQDLWRRALERSPDDGDIQRKLETP
ncbi:MAG: tetratricopeptide repeat protein, partial [Gemmatimonadetes bacterium]|nr:tetratricopeptide repeat protein [Gemmatimonadota bacterium]